MSETPASEKKMNCQRSVRAKSSTWGHRKEVQSVKRQPAIRPLMNTGFVLGWMTVSRKLNAVANRLQESEKMASTSKTKGG